jgi:hypothetical protein
MRAPVVKASIIEAGLFVIDSIPLYPIPHLASPLKGEELNFFSVSMSGARLALERVD